jgi:hypothetical protein
MWGFAVQIELANMVAVQCLHDADPGEHRRAASGARDRLQYTARAASGHAVAPPRAAMNSRRLMPAAKKTKRPIVIVRMGSMQE